MDPSAAMLDMERSGKNESLNRSIDPIPDTSASMEESVVDVRIGRPLHVNVSLTMHDIKAHLMKVFHFSRNELSLICAKIPIHYLLQSNSIVAKMILRAQLFFWRNSLLKCTRHFLRLNSSFSYRRQFYILRTPFYGQQRVAIFSKVF